jgi:broad specificity phosphatase PhoE
MEMKSQTTIYFIRHGETKNPHKILVGALPNKLTKNGEEQVKKVGKYLSSKKISVIYYSPIRRTEQSAKIIKKYFQKINFISKKEIQEWLIGFDGAKREVLEKENWFKLFEITPTKVRLGKGGESLKDVQGRMIKFYKKIIKEHKKQEIICVSHQSPIQALILYLQEKDLDTLIKVKCELSSINKLVIDDKGKLKSLEYIKLK